MNKIFLSLIVFAFSSPSFSAQSAVTVNKSARPVEGTKTVGITGKAAKEMYESLSQISETKIEGTKSDLIRESSNIQCTKHMKKHLYECYFDLSTNGAVLSPRME
jgi:hypothetical protein